MGFKGFLVMERGHFVLFWCVASFILLMALSTCMGGLPALISLYKSSHLVSSPYVFFPFCWIIGAGLYIAFHKSQQTYGRFVYLIFALLIWYFSFHALFTNLFVPNNHVSLAYNNDSHGSREVLAEYNNLQDCEDRAKIYTYLLKPGTLHCISEDNKILSTKVFGDGGK